ncbi:unnamed protein product, partial [marine sediment metagenome]
MVVSLHIIGDGFRQMMFQSRILYSKKPILSELKEWIYHCIPLTATFTSDCKVLIRILATAGVTISVGYFQIRILQEIKALRAEKTLRPVATFDAFADDNNETPDKET